MLRSLPQAAHGAARRAALAAAGPPLSPSSSLLLLLLPAGTIAECSSSSEGKQRLPWETWGLQRNLAPPASRQHWQAHQQGGQGWIAAAAARSAP